MSRPEAEAVGAAENLEGAQPNEEVKEKKPPKKKFALCVAYLGKGYQGLQKNPNAKTIEV